MIKIPTVGIFIGFFIVVSLQAMHNKKNSSHAKPFAKAPHSSSRRSSAVEPKVNIKLEQVLEQLAAYEQKLAQDILHKEVDFELLNSSLSLIGRVYAVNREKTLLQLALYLSSSNRELLIKLAEDLKVEKSNKPSSSPAKKETQSVESSPHRHRHVDARASTHTPLFVSRIFSPPPGSNSNKSKYPS